MIRRSILASACAAAVVAPFAAFAVSAGAAPQALDLGQLVPKFLIWDSHITGSSGLAASSRDSNLYFTHNDKGDSARLFAIDTRGGTQAVLNVRGATNVDWEDVASGPNRTLWVGDVGDDLRNRPNIAVYKLNEPATFEEDMTVSATKYTFTYPDGPQNSEAILVHPKSGQVYVVTTGLLGGAIYKAPATLSTSRANKLTKVATAPAGVSGGAFAPNGAQFTLVSALQTHTYTSIGGTPKVGLKPVLLDGESVTYSRDGAKLLMGSEGLLSPVYEVSIDGSTPTPTPTPTPTKTPTPTPTKTPTPTPTKTPTPTPTPTKTPTPTPTPTSSPDPSGWQLQYDTKFNNLDGWTIYNNQTQNNDNSINMAKNVTAGSGGLNIAGKRESGYNRPFTSGEIVGRSGKLVVPNYFRAEVTGSFQDLSGIWPCLLWFRPENASDGEIDVMEWMGGMWSGDQKRVAITMHNEYGATQDSIKKPLILKNHSWFSPNAQHTYTIEKVPGSITVWVDGRKLSTFTAADKGWWNRIMEVKDRTWYPRITLQIGQGSKTKVVPNPDSSFSSTNVKVTSFKLWTQKK